MVPEFISKKDRVDMLSTTKLFYTFSSRNVKQNINCIRVFLRLKTCLVSNFNIFREEKIPETKAVTLSPQSNTILCVT